MLHQLLRSLGRRSHTTRRLSRRKFSPNAHRTDAGIERLEERMLLSGTAYGEPDSATVEAPENNRPRSWGHLIIGRVADGDPVEVSYHLGGEDRDGDSSRFEIVSPPDVGTVEIDEDFVAPDLYDTIRCDFTFRAPDGWRGGTMFSFRMFDGLEYSDVIGVSVYVETDHPPTLEDQTYKGLQDQTVVGKLEWHDPDYDILFVDVKAPPKVGTLVISDDTTGDFVYTPPKGFSGTVTFAYGLRGPWGAYSQTATVTIVVEPIAEPVDEQPVDEQPDHNNPPVQEPQIQSPIDTATTTPSNEVDSPSDDPPVIASDVIAPEQLDASGQEDGDKDSSPEGNDFTQAIRIFVAPTSDPDDVQPAKIASVIFGAQELNVHHLLAHSLQLTRWDQEGGDATDVVKPDSYEYRDVNGDGRDDLIAVFELDWAELWDGQESAILTGRLA